MKTRTPIGAGAALLPAPAARPAYVRALSALGAHQVALEWAERAPAGFAPAELESLRLDVAAQFLRWGDPELRERARALLEAAVHDRERAAFDLWRLWLDEGQGERVLRAHDARRSPAPAWARLLAAEAALELGRASRALALLPPQADDDDVPAGLLRARAWAAAGRLAEARRHLRLLADRAGPELLARDGLSELNWARLEVEIEAQRLRALGGDAAGARRALERLLERAPLSQELHEALAWMLERQGRRGEARRRREEARAPRAAAPAWPRNGFVSLCYHDVAENVEGNKYSVRPRVLVEQLEYLKATHSVVGLDDVLRARAGGPPLPARAVLLTVDDGLLSFYEAFYPLLRAYAYPAVLAVVGRWTDEGRLEAYNWITRREGRMASWAQLREMSRSGLVQVVPHSYDLHRRGALDPQGDEAPLAGFPAYDAASGRYESREAFRARVRRDLSRNAAQIRRRVGRAYPVMVWPYGSFQGDSLRAAEEAGLSLHFSVDEGFNEAAGLRVVRRGMVMATHGLDDFRELLGRGFRSGDPLRALSLDLDLVRDPEATAQ